MYILGQEVCRPISDHNEITYWVHLEQPYDYLDSEIFSKHKHNWFLVPPCTLRIKGLKTKNEKNNYHNNLVL